RGKRQEARGKRQKARGNADLTPDSRLPTPDSRLPIILRVFFSYRLPDIKDNHKVRIGH
ncbi:MAG: hypothetical protein F6K38_42060, partial [Moorea sp. SIO3B2]|nr:hypothetical protein [Moorena sp. SIO3B2]